jgi:hypothetical protein
MNVKEFNAMRRKSLADLVLKKRDSTGLNQRDFCDWLLTQVQDSDQYGASIDDLTYGALQSWENPAHRGKLPNADNFWMLSKVLGFTSMDQFLLFLGTGTLVPSSQDDKFEPEQMKNKVLNMDRSFKIDLLKRLQVDLLEE